MLPRRPALPVLPFVVTPRAATSPTRQIDIFLRDIQRPRDSYLALELRLLMDMLLSEDDLRLARPVQVPWSGENLR